MTTLDDLFATEYARQSDAVAQPDVTELGLAVVGGATRRRRGRLAVNAGLTVAASVVVAALAWGSLHTGATPADAPTPEPTLTGALPAPTLNPVWNGGLYPLAQDVPAAFADDFDTASLTPAPDMGPNYPVAYRMTDALWDQVEPGWSLQTWHGPGLDEPVNLYLVSPGGTFLLLRTLEAFEGSEQWGVASWSARPARAVLVGVDDEQGRVTRRLVDLRTGESLRVAGFENGVAHDQATVLASGFADGRSLQIDFPYSGGNSFESGSYDIDGPVRVTVVAPDGSTTEVAGVSGITSVPVVTSGAGDGHTAVIHSASGAPVFVVDLDAARARAVTPELGENDSCAAFAVVGFTLVGSCFHGDVSTLMTFDAHSGQLLSAVEAGTSPSELQAFTADATAIVDALTGAEIDITRATSLAWAAAAIPIGEHAFALTGGSQLVVYDRDSRESYVVVGDTVPGSRAEAAASSVAVFPDRTHGAIAPLDLREFGW